MRFARTSTERNIIRSAVTLWTEQKSNKDIRNRDRSNKAAQTRSQNRSKSKQLK